MDHDDPELAAAFQAAREGAPAFFKAVEGLDTSKCIEAVDRGGCSLSYWAARAGSLEVLELLHEAGADVHRPNKRDTSPAYWAADKGHEDCLRFLIEHQANLELVNDQKRGPLFQAAQEGRVNTLVMLIEQDVVLDRKDMNGDTATAIAVKRRNFECAFIMRLVTHTMEDVTENELEKCTPETLLSALPIAFRRKPIETILTVAAISARTKVWREKSGEMLTTADEAQRALSVLLNECDFPSLSLIVTHRLPSAPQHSHPLCPP